MQPAPAAPQAGLPSTAVELALGLFLAARTIVDALDRRPQQAVEKAARQTAQASKKQKPEVCQKETESQLHRCGRETRLRRGWRWLNNDAVNFISSVVGGGIAALLGWLVLS